jgi:hypothetical protein
MIQLVKETLMTMFTRVAPASKEMINERTRIPPSQGVHEDDAPVEGRP